MATLPGFLPAWELRGFPPVLSADLDQHSASFGGGALGSPGAPGALAGGGVVALVSQGLAGSEAPMFGGELFEKVLVLPRTKDVGFLLSAVVWDVEVWNTHRREARALTGITVTGSGGLQVTGGLGDTATFGPGQSSIYLATLAGQGDATIATVATWSFTGETGADMAVTGTRLTLFSPRCDWSEPFREVLGWKTTVLTAYSRAEQRASLRTRPRVGLAFRVASTTAREAAALEALLHGWQARVFGVPVWPEKSALLASAATGSNVLQASTQDRPSFEVGGLVALWRDPFTWKAFSVSAVSAGSVTLATQLTEDWAAGAWVVPVRRGRLLQEQALGRPTNWLRDGNFSFSCEAL